MEKNSIRFDSRWSFLVHVRDLHPRMHPRNIIFHRNRKMGYPSFHGQSSQWLRIPCRNHPPSISKGRNDVFLGNAGNHRLCHTDVYHFCVCFRSLEVHLSSKSDDIADNAKKSLTEHGFDRYFFFGFSLTMHFKSSLSQNGHRKGIVLKLKSLTLTMLKFFWHFLLRHRKNCTDIYTAMAKISPSPPSSPSGWMIEIFWLPQ